MHIIVSLSKPFHFPFSTTKQKKLLIDSTEIVTATLSIRKQTDQKKTKKKEEEKMAITLQMKKIQKATDIQRDMQQNA